MNDLKDKFERFQTKTIKEFTNKDFYTKIEYVKDTFLRKEWYNVIWKNIPINVTLVKDLFKCMYIIKSKSYKKEKDAIQHFNQIIKSQLNEI